MYRFCLALFLSLFGFSALAECVQFQAIWRGEPGPWSSSKEAACSALNGKSYTSGTGTNASTLSVSGAAVDSSGNCAYKETTTYASPGTPPYVGTGSAAILRRTVAVCDDPCQERAGTSSIVNVTSGWKRTPKPTADSEEWVVVYRLPPSNTATLCGGPDICQMTIDGNEPCSDCGGYVSQTPGANGMYRVSTDFRGHYTGKSCSASETSDLPPEALQKDDTKDPPCPGYVGEVNGVKGCFGTADKPIRPVPAPTKPAGVSSTDAGNPAAGTKPTSGEGSGTGGSGRTPTAGAGGSSGGPSGAAAGSGTKPDGTTPKPTDGKEQAACGAPGQPKCQIDETGTPNGSDSKDKLTDAVNKAADDTKAAIENASKLQAPGWTFTFALPSGCSALSLAGYQIPGQGALTLDVCKWQPMIHDIMSMLWLICTVWGCINMVGATLRGA